MRFLRWGWLGASPFLDNYVGGLFTWVAQADNREVGQVGQVGTALRSGPSADGNRADACGEASLPQQGVQKIEMRPVWLGWLHERDTVRRRGGVCWVGVFTRLFWRAASRHSQVIGVGV